MPDALVSCRTDNGVAVLEMNDPPANTYSYGMMRQLDDAILRARMDDSVHVLVLRGAGDKFFSAGADIRMLASMTPRFKYYLFLHANENLKRLDHTPQAVVAALHRRARGGGPQMPLGAGPRIART